MQDVGQLVIGHQPEKGLSARARQADAEQVLAGGIHAGHPQVPVEDDGRRDEGAEDVLGETAGGGGGRTAGTVPAGAA